MPDAVLFDLDGTLIDTAPDMGEALSNLLIEEKRAPLPLESIRPYVSQGGLVLTRLGFDGHVDEAEIEPLRLRFLWRACWRVSTPAVSCESIATIPARRARPCRSAPIPRQMKMIAFPTR